MRGGPQSGGHQAQHRQPQRLGIGDVIGREPVAQGADQRRCDDQIAEIRQKQHHGAEHRPHAALRQIVEQPEAGTDIEVDRGDEDPQHRLGKREIAGVVHHPRGESCEADTAGEQPHDAARIAHAAAGHQDAGHDGRDTSPPQVHVLRHDARLADAHVVSALQEGRCPEHESPAPQRAHRAAHHHMHRGALLPQEAHRLEHRWRLAVVAGIETSAPRLAHREPHREPGQHARDPEREEHRAPAVMIGDGAGDVVAHPGADRRAEGEHRERHGAPRGGEVVGEQRIRTRRAAGFSDGDPDAGEEKLP